MQDSIIKVLDFVTEDYFTQGEVEEINETIGWMAGMPADWQPPFNTLVVLYNTVKGIRQQIGQAGGDCTILLQQCAKRLCAVLPQFELFKTGLVQDTALDMPLQRYYLQQLINGMWDKNIHCQSTDEIVISQILEIYKVKLAEATKLLNKGSLWYEAYWLPLLYCITRPVDGGWKLNGISNRLYQSLKDAEAYQQLVEAKPIIYYTMELLTWLPVKVDVAVDYSHSRDLTLYWVQWSSDDESCWDQELSGYTFGEEPFNEMWSSSLKIDENNLMGLLGIEVNSHAKE